MLRRYFSMKSPSCFGAPAAVSSVELVVLLAVLENSDDGIAWLAKAFSPFSISPIIFCHNATGSLLVSDIRVLLHAGPGLHTTRLRRAANIGQVNHGRGRRRTTSATERTVP